MDLWEPVDANHTVKKELFYESDASLLMCCSFAWAHASVVGP